MANPNQVGAFVGTTFEWDVSEIYEIDVTSPQFKELLVRLYQNINSIALLLNIKDTGYYNTQEFVNGQLLFPNPLSVSSTSSMAPFRQIFRTLVNFGALPDSTAKPIAHGIDFTTTYTATRIYGSASDTTSRNYIPLPYASPTIANNISVFVDATHVTITTAADWSMYDTCYVIIEYVKN
jgi:hypothetical protein